MTNSITRTILKSSLAFSVLFTAGSPSFAQHNFLADLAGKGNPAITKSLQNGSHARINTVISRPGNSQDFMTLGNGTWQLQTNSAYTYDSQGRLTQRLYTDPATGQNIRRDLTVYDAQGNETEFRGEEWVNGTWAIMYGYKDLNTYNAQNLKTETIYQSWNGSNNTWENDGREQTAYDASNLVTSITNSEWNNNAWDLTDRMNLSNTNGTATTAIMQEYEPSTATWQDMYRAQNITWHVLYETPSAYEMQYKDNGAWVNDEKYTAVYNANGGHAGVYENWNGMTNAWEKTSRETESFDSNNNYTGWLDEDWNANTAAWDFASEEREVLTYSGIDITQRIFQDTHNPGNQLQDQNKEVYSNFQTFTISGLKPEVAQISANVYPNPATDVLKINFPENTSNLTAILTDVTGKTWQTKIFRTEEAKQLNIEALPKGIYQLQLQTEKGSTVKRIVKQ